MASYDEAGKRLEAIRRRANSLWLAEGKIDGRDKAHWEEAERQVDLEAMSASKNGVESESAIAASIREAYQAGRASIASEVKSRMANIFEGLERGDFETQR
jgi:hypothetical protein